MASSGRESATAEEDQEDLEDDESTESDLQALLNTRCLSMQEDDTRSTSTESMTSLIKNQRSTRPLTVNNSDNSNDIALDCRADPHHLDDEQLRAHGHEAALKRSFSPLAAIGLGFRYFGLTEGLSRD